MFHVIQDAFCITRNKRGVYKQAKVYRYHDGLYVGAFGGFVRLLRDGDCATPDMSYVELSTAGLNVTRDEIGRLVIVKS